MNYTRETRDEEVIRGEAHIHFMEHGDKVKIKTEHDPHSSYDVLRGYLTKYAYGRLGRNWQDAEDATQDAYVKVLETAKVNEFFNFGGLYKIWLDRAIRDIRIENRKSNDLFVDNDEVEGGEGLTIIDLAESEDAPTDLLLSIQTRVNAIMDTTNKLSTKAKAIIRLTVLFGYSYKEVAKMMDVDVKRVENTLVYFRRIHRGD